MKKKGFTLIELLAVIVILGIIALVVGAVISNVIEKTKRETFRQSVAGMIKAGEHYIAKHFITSTGGLVYPVTFICDGQVCTNGIDALEFKGAVPISGAIIIDANNAARASYIFDGRYCATGVKDNIQLADNCADIDAASPTITGVLEGRILKLNLTDNESGIAGYCVTTTNSVGSCNWVTTSQSYVEHTLSTSGTYYAFAKDRKENVSEYVSFTTGDIDNPSIQAAMSSKNIVLALLDNVGVTEYCLTTTNDSSSCSWVVTNDTSAVIPVSVSGTYYAFAKDAAGNISDVKIIETGDIEEPIVTGSITGKVISLTLSDNVGVTGYCITDTDTSSSCNWLVPASSSVSYTLTQAGTYYAFAKDAALNISTGLSFVADQSAFCAYQAGHEWDFAYTGGVQSFTVPCDGLYKLEVWGAQGGSGDCAGGKGGYSVGYLSPNKDSVWYVVVGSQGSTHGYATAAGGYNGGGGGNGGNGSHACIHAGGGGATHVGLTNALLRNTTSANVILVAGGGGGCSSYGSIQNSSGGTGGGTSGGNGNGQVGGGNNGYYGTGGTQTGAGTPIYSVGTSQTRGGYGYGGTGDVAEYGFFQAASGGGGGYYGGGGGWVSEYPGVAVGGGGSGYIGGIPEIEYNGTTYTPSMSSGVQSGNGKAKITLIEY